MAANDNQPRSPAEHRRILAAQRQHQGDDEPEQTGAWPQGRRLHKAGNMVRLRGLADWQVRNGMPKLSAANDNIAVNIKNTETVQRDSVDADEIMAAIEKERDEPGEHYREDTLEVHVRGNWRSIMAETEFARKHSSSTPSWLVDDEDEEDKMVRMIDCKRVRERLGPKVCDILDAAASDATTAELAGIIGCGKNATAGHVDAAIEEYLKIAA